jgi:hypothetical protein
MDKRHFTVVIGSKEHGLYVSSTPSSAAKKAVSKLCASNKSKKVEFYLREITQGSKKKTYGPYLGEMKKLKTPIELKGRVIQYETKVHLKKVKKSMKGGKYQLYSCGNETKKIEELCVDSSNGKFYFKNKCETECLDQKLIVELEAWKKLFKWCSENLSENPIYCKGGSALGLEVLKSILNQDPSKYTEFLDLGLIKDWDFTVFMSEEQKIRFIDFASTLGIENQGQSISILRFKKGLHIGEDYLLELSVKTNQLLNDLELPLTNLKFEVNFHNIDKFFEIVVMYVKKNENLDVMKRNLNELLNPVLVNGEELVDSIENGFYNITDPSKIDTAGLSQQLLELIDFFLQQPNNNNSNRSNNLAIKQFLITQLIQPDRLFIRFLKKNVEKSKKITKFYEKNGIPIPNWLMNKKVLEIIERKINLFLDFLNLYINSALVIPDELLDTKIDSTKQIKDQFKDFITKMELLFMNMNLSRLHTDKIDKDKIEKLLPILYFSKLKDYTLTRKQIKNQADLEKFKNNPVVLGKKMKALELESKNPQLINYDFYLPKGNGKYLEFIRYFLSHIYKNVPNQSMRFPNQN